MARRSDPLETTLIAIEMLRRIPRGGKVSAPELKIQLEQAGFKRNLRTIQRLLKQLSVHFDIECDDRGKPHGYRWLPNSKAIAVGNLSAQESMLLLMAQEHMRFLLPPKIMKSMDGYFRQARQNLATVGIGKLEAQWPAKVRVVPATQPQVPPKIDLAVFETVTQALYANRYVKLDYRNATGERKQHTIMPLGLVTQGVRIYMVCRYEGHENNRIIAMHRILTATESTLEFRRPRNFDLNQYAQSGHFNFGNGQRVRLRFRTNAKNALHLQEAPLSADQKLELLKDGDSDVTATVYGGFLLETWLHGFSRRIHHVKVVPVP